MNFLALRLTARASSPMRPHRRMACIDRKTPGCRPGLAALACALAATWALHTGAGAQTVWPAKPVTLVIPFAAGGPTDVGPRMLAIPMGKSLAQPVLVNNTVGAGGTIATTKVARAPANGNTVSLHHMGMSTAPALYKKLAFDPLKDFEYIGQVLDVPMTLLGRRDFPANNLQ